MYATDYGDLAFAKGEYRRLGALASPCLNCDGQPCRNACPHGLQIDRLCGPAHLMLS
jgi:Fe-S-cluster-containing hydrogenase component 2